SRLRRRLPRHAAGQVDGNLPHWFDLHVRRAVQRKRHARRRSRRNLDPAPRGVPGSGAEHRARLQAASRRLPRPKGEPMTRAPPSAASREPGGRGRDWSLLQLLLTMATLGAAVYAFAGLPRIPSSAPSLPADLELQLELLVRSPTLEQLDAAIML